MTQGQSVPFSVSSVGSYSEANTNPGHFNQVTAQVISFCKLLLSCEAEVVLLTPRHLDIVNPSLRTSQSSFLLCFIYLLVMILNAKLTKWVVPKILEATMSSVLVEMRTIPHHNTQLHNMETHGKEPVCFPEDPLAPLIARKAGLQNTSLIIFPSQCSQINLKNYHFLCTV